jgi:hypothetical protein
VVLRRRWVSDGVGRAGVGSPVVWVAPANGSVAWCGSAVETLSWLLGSPVMTFRPATCVDGAPALDLRQWCCVGVVLPDPSRVILVFLLWTDLLFLSHFNFLQLLMCQDGIRGCKRCLLQMIRT